MTTERLNRIKEELDWQAEIAQKILMGDHDGYDGADGARTVRDLCDMAQELIEVIENQDLNPTTV